MTKIKTIAETSFKFPRIEMTWLCKLQATFMELNLIYNNKILKFNQIFK